MSTVRTQPSTALLKAHYPAVYSLRVYLFQILDDAENVRLVQDDDSEAYRQFAHGTYVALKKDMAMRLRVGYPMMYMRDVIKRAQSDILRRPKILASNVITAGYRLAHRESSAVAVQNHAVVNYYVNTIVTALQSPEWETLLSRIGEDAMLHLLKDCSIFVSLPNNCFCQLTGMSLVNLKGFTSDLPQTSAIVDKKRKTSELEESDRSSKRRKLQANFSNTTTDSRGSHSELKPQKKPPRPSSEIKFSRVRMFYSRPTFIPNSQAVMVGFPAQHVLNRLNPAYIRQIKREDWKDPDPNEQMNNARHLAKYVFPRQHALSNPFNMPVDDTDAFYDHRREDEFKQRRFIKTPKRVKPALDLLEKLIWRHGKCRHKILQDRICPTKIDNSKDLDESQIIARRIQFLEYMSEHSSRIVSQAQAGDGSVDSHGVTISAAGLTQNEEMFKEKPRCVDFSINHSEVYRYAITVTKQVIPSAFWGCYNNFEVIKSYIRQFIDGRRYEMMSLHNVLQNFSTSECDWVISDNPAAQKYSRVCVTDSLKRRELIEDFIYWYFNSFLLPLLKTSFYATESSMFRNQILYFRQDDWKALCEPLIERLTSVTFKEIQPDVAQELLRQRNLGFSFVRLLPKEAGVRPIVNLRRKAVTNVKGQHESINWILKAAFEILTYEKETRPEYLGESVFGPDEIYRKLKAFKTQITNKSGSSNLPKLYIVKVDVQACFDTIDQTKLLEIIRDLISEETYTIRRYGSIAPSMGKFQRRFLRKAFPDEHTDFFPYAVELASALRNTVFVDQVPYHSQSKQEVLELLEEHITENVVKIGNKYYRQVVGIPQGSILSTLLCSFSYGDLERRKFKFGEDSECMLMRLVDDYLFISADISKARNFLQMMSEGHPEYGCRISPDKTRTNFDFESQLDNVVDPDQKHFPWCGYLINMQDLSVSTDYSRFNRTYLQDSLTVYTGREPGVAFKQKMLKWCGHKSHAIFCDTALNSVHGVYFNIYTHFLLSAMKMHRYLEIWGVDINKSIKLVSDTMDQMIKRTYPMIQNKISNKVAKSLCARCDIKAASVIWLGSHAFHTVLSRFPTKYSELIRKLESELSRPQHKGLKREFGTLIQDGLKTFSHIDI